MKIILKNNHGTIKKFNNKTELVNYVKNYLEWQTGELLTTDMTINAIIRKYFGDYIRLNEEEN